MPRPLKGKAKVKLPGKAKPSKKPAQQAGGGDNMETDAPKHASVWRPGIDPIGEDEELEYDVTAYDCFHRLQLDWPCLSFDLIKDDLGAPRSAFPHTLFMVAGTQAPSAKQNYVAFIKLAGLGQGRHGRRDKKASRRKQDDDDEDEGDISESDSDASSSGSDGEGEDDGGEEGEEGEDGQPKVPEGKMEAKGSSGEAPARMHMRAVNWGCGVNRVRQMPQQPGIVAVWGENGQVKVLDGSRLLAELAAEVEPTSKSRSRVELKPLASHMHSTEGYAVDWSTVAVGRLATGDCRKAIHIWEPQEGGRWQVGAAHQGHEGSVEDLQWSPSEANVFASCSMDKTIRIWDVRERAKSMISVVAHDTDVNVISWNPTVHYMLASGADDGTLRCWDLRNLTAGQHVAHFAFHKSAVTSVEWSPYEGSMLASAGADNQLAVWDLALERDPEEEAALAHAGNAAAPSDLPAQLLFLHAGQTDLKELHWHAQIPGLIVTTAGDGFNVFKAANV